MILLESSNKVRNPIQNLLNQRDSDWIFDGMNVVQVKPISFPWKELADTFLEAVTNQGHLQPASIQIIRGIYNNNRIKDMTQMSRGISDRRIFK